MSQQQPSVLIRLREMILRGDLSPGERLFEVELADRLQVSRTPIRQALPALAMEGLLMPAGRGYCVRSFTREESVGALHLRALLEGHAARLIVLKGRAQMAIDVLTPLLDEIDAILDVRPSYITLRDVYGRLNARFHDIILEQAMDSLLTDLIARCNVVPFTAPDMVAFDEQDEETILQTLRYAHRQHHAIVDALRTLDGTRVEMLFREHAMTQEASMISTGSGE